MTTVQTVPAKTIVTRNSSPDAWFGHDYNMNIYRGCCHGCIYCDSRSDCYRIDDFDRVRAKENAIEIIRKELQGRRAHGVIATGAMSDPYNPVERELELTRAALKIIRSNGFGITIATKSDLITRDIDILSDINATAPVCIKITITTFSDETAGIIEPGAASSSARFKALKKLAAAGLFCGVLLMPLLPFINDTAENITAIVKATAEAGGKFVHFWPGVTLRQNQRDYFYDRIDQHFPGLRARYHATFAGSYQCLSPDGSNLRKLFRELCSQHGLLSEMPEIIAAYKINKGPGQLSLFP